MKPNFDLRLRSLALGVLLVTTLGGIGAARGESWEAAFARMPLGTNVSELNRSNCVPLLLRAFLRNKAVKGLVFMPGATDEFYFFRRAHAKLGMTEPTLLDAITALTNQTYIQAEFYPPFLLLHSVEDPLQPLIEVSDAKLAAKLRQKRFGKRILYNDRQWDYLNRELAIRFNRTVLPERGDQESFHFYRHSLAGYDLTCWEALEALSLAGKTTVTLEKRGIVFRGDPRFGEKPKMDHFPYEIMPK